MIRLDMREGASRVSKETIRGSYFHPVPAGENNWRSSSLTKTNGSEFRAGRACDPEYHY